MDIKLKILKQGIVLGSIFSIHLFAEDNVKDIPISFAPSTFVDTKYSNLGSPDNFSKKVYRLIENSTVVNFDKAIRLDDEVKRIGKYVYEIKTGKLANSLNQNLENELKSKTALKLLIDTKDDRNIMISDGSFIVRSSKITDFSKLASDYDLILIRNFPSINSAVFQVKSFTILENTMNLIQNLDSRIYVEHNFIDPNKIPE